MCGLWCFYGGCNVHIVHHCNVCNLTNAFIIEGDGMDWPFNTEGIK